MTTSLFYYAEMNTPVGPLLVVGNEKELIRIDFGTFQEHKDSHQQWFEKFFKEVTFTPAKNLYKEIEQEFYEYFMKKRKNFSFAFKMHGTSFQKRVWKALYETTPYGETKSYQELAETIDHPKAVRAIGGAMNRNPLSIVIPCHRVIGKNKQLTGYGGGLEKKEYLLTLEGVL